MRLKIFPAIVVIALLSCRTQAPSGDDGRIELTLVQVNDVYEIAPLEAGNSGGMARVAALKKREQQKNPNTLLVMAGDFLSPSVYGSLRYEGKRIRGRQMVDAMNAAGFDLVCFGNHEFDITEAELQERIEESGFTWISANAFHKTGDSIHPFENKRTRTAFPRYVFRNFTDADGTRARIGLISVVLPSNPAEYVQYADPVKTFIETYTQVKDSCDAIVALTHLAVADDRRLAEAIPELAIILGGHEHDMRFVKENGVFITKAHANAKSAFVVQLTLDTRKHRVSASPSLVYLDRSIPEDSLSNLTVQKWVKVAADNYASAGFSPDAIVPFPGDSLEGRELYTRHGATNLTDLVARAMLFAAPAAEASVFNTGSIRVDDILYKPISQYDILRTLPFGGGLRELELKGSLLKNVLDAGYANRGSGGWLQYGNIRRSGESWLVKEQPLDTGRSYRIVVPDFLVTGKETNLGFFNESNPGITTISPVQTDTSSLMSDIRLAIIRYLEVKRS
ncbi:MAG TPA: bifunctional metallophosphatase/5'-nucleotidase [Chitinophagaceae bacterium]